MESKEKIAALSQFLSPTRSERLTAIAAQRTTSLTILLDNVRNFFNISAVVRSADAFGICDIHMIGQEFTYTPDISKGSERWLKLHRYGTAEEAVESLEREGFSLVMFQPENDRRRDESIPLLPVTQLPFESKLALVFGNEQSGVSSEIARRAKIHAFIPMAGFVESLNISVSCAIALFCSHIASCPLQRRSPLIAEVERDRLLVELLQQSLRGGPEILREVEWRQKKGLEKS